MFMINPFTELSASISPAIMQGYIILMVILVAGGTILDMLHKKSAQYFFENAEKAFLKFRDKFQDSKLTDDALYFIGYIQFLKGNYEKASIRFFELIEQHQESNRLNDSIWWLAVTLERSGDLGSAIDMYQRLLKSNPSGNLKSSSESRIEDLKAILEKRK